MNDLLPSLGWMLQRLHVVVMLLSRNKSLWLESRMEKCSKQNKLRYKSEVLWCNTSTLFKYSTTTGHSNIYYIVYPVLGRLARHRWCQALPFQIFLFILDTIIFSGIVHLKYARIIIAGFSLCNMKASHNILNLVTMKQMHSSGNRAWFSGEIIKQMNKWILEVSVVSSNYFRKDPRGG